jgi:hypothetical protein
MADDILSERLCIVWILVLMSRMRKLNMKKSGGRNFMAWYVAVDIADRAKTPGM